MKVTYVRSELSSQSDAVKNEVDPAFINDNYWLLFPFHAYWDTSATVTDQGMQKLPLGNGSAELVAVKYPAEPAVTRPATPGNSTSAKTTASSNLSSTTAGPKSRAVVIATWAGYKKAARC